MLTLCKLIQINTNEENNQNFISTYFAVDISEIIKNLNLIIDYLDIKLKDILVDIKSFKAWESNEDEKNKIMQKVKNIYDSYIIFLVECFNTLNEFNDTKVEVNLQSDKLIKEIEKRVTINIPKLMISYQKYKNSEQYKLDIERENEIKNIIDEIKN